YRRVKDMIERGHARLHAVVELSPGPPRDVMGGKTRVPSKALPVVAPKQLSHTRKSEPTVGAFGEQAHTRECPQQPIEPVLLHSGFTGYISTLPRSLRELVGDADFNYRAKCLADPLPDDHLE